MKSENDIGFSQLNKGLIPLANQYAANHHVNLKFIRIVCRGVSSFLVRVAMTLVFKFIEVCPALTHTDQDQITYKITYVIFSQFWAVLNTCDLIVSPL